MTIRITRTKVVKPTLNVKDNRDNYEKQRGKWPRSGAWLYFLNMLCCTV